MFVEPLLSPSKVGLKSTPYRATSKEGGLWRERGDGGSVCACRAAEGKRAFGPVAGEAPDEVSAGVPFPFRSGILWSATAPA